MSKTLSEYVKQALDEFKNIFEIIHWRKKSCFVIKNRWPLRNQKWHFFGGKSKNEKHASRQKGICERSMFLFFWFTPEKVPLLITQRLKPLYFIYKGTVLQAHCKFLLMRGISNFLYLFTYLYILCIILFAKNTFNHLKQVLLIGGQMSLECI